jgi:hypothetical protein
MATKRQRRKRRRERGPGAPARPAPRVADASGSGASASGSAAGPARATRSASRRAGAADPPSALWGSFPLTEIVIFIGLVLLVVGFFVTPPQGFVMIAVGLGLGSLAGLELALREHFAAYRSHTLVLSAAIGVPVFGALFVLTKLSPAVCVAAGLLAFAGAAWLFASAFSRRSGGALYRLKG